MSHSLKTINVSIKRRYRSGSRSTDKCPRFRQMLWVLSFSWLPLCAGHFLFGPAGPKRKQKGLVPTRINSVGIVVPNKAIASKRLRSNLHAYFSQCWGRVCVYCFYLIYYLAYVLCFKAKIAVPVLRSLSLYWNRLNIYVVLFVPLNVFNLKKFHLAGAFNRR